MYLKLLILLFTAALPAADSHQFRGPERNGIFPETGLLKQWPETGPKRDWLAEGFGKGYASVSVVDGVVYTTGLMDGTGYLFAVNAGTGKQIYRVAYGPEHDGDGYEGARCTPTVVDGKAYIISGLGVVSCFNTADGKQLWQVDTLKRFGQGISASRLIPRWAISESLLVDGNRVICTPGTPDSTLVALNKDTGETIWTSKGLSDKSSYCSTRIMTVGKQRHLVTLTARQLVGLNPETGAILWQHAYKGQYDIHANSPVFIGRDIYVSDGYGQGGALFRLAQDGQSVKQIWTEQSLDIHHGGAVVLDGKIYGADSRGIWMALDGATGEIAGKGRGVGKGAVIYADGMLYGYGNRGQMGLIDPNSPELVPVSTFNIEEGSGRHWAHPVISDKRLYIRRGSALMRFNIAAD